MTDENENRRHDYEDGTLFPDGNAPKPLFPETEKPSVKPLFEKPSGPEAVIRDTLKTEGPVAFVDQQHPASRPDDFLAKPSEGPTAYEEHPEAPEISEPIVVRTKEVRDEEAFPATLDVPDQKIESPGNMTEKVSDNTSFLEKKETVQEEPKLKSARPLPARNTPRFGKVRAREAILPEGMNRSKRALSLDPASATLGNIMKDARNQAGMTLSQVAAATRIKTSYIEAIEADDFKSLPAGIFPSAYVRTLCGTYNLTEECREIALQKVTETLGHLDEVPKELLQHLEQDVQKNEKEEKRITKIFYIVSFCAALILILIATGIVMLAFSLKKPAESAPPVQTAEVNRTETPKRTRAVEIFDSGKLETLTPPQIPSLMGELPVPKK